MERNELATIHGQVWDTAELQRDFSVKGFMAPFVTVIRKTDGVAGMLQFQHAPRLYFNFEVTGDIT